MNLVQEYEITKRELLKVQLKMSILEDDGLYGTSQYAALTEQEANLEDELESIQEEMDR